MKKANIPSQFTLGGIPFQVQRKKITLDDNRMAGAADYRNQIVYVDAENGTIESIEQTFYHEALHCIMHILGKYELRDDEEFIEQTSQLIYQLIKTSK